MHKRLSRSLLLTAGLGLLACGGPATTTVTPDPTSSPSATPSAAGSTTPAAAPSGAPAAAQKTPERQAFPACAGDFPITAPNPKYVWTPKAIHLISKKLAPGVFAVYDDKADEYAPKGIPLATSGGFVIGDNGVMLVETMINRQLFCQLITLVRAETDKPVTHVVNTSSHGDHSYGNAFLPKGVHIAQHENTAAYIAAHFKEDVDFMKTNFGADQGLDELQPVAADILVKNEGTSIDLGNKVVELHYYGFGQTTGDLFVVVPSAKVVWTGNALVTEKPGIPWLLDGHAKDVSATLAAVKAASPKDAIIVPGHDRPVAVDGFDFSIQYLNKLITDVGGAAKAGKSEAQTVAAVTMKEFQGYRLWDWIHKQVNVPKTYAELKKK